MTIAQLIGVLIAASAVSVTVGALVFRGSRWVGGVNERLNTHDSLLAEVRGDIVTMRRDMGKVFALLPSPALDSASPLRLNALGEDIAERLEAAAWAERVAQEVGESVSGMEPYQIQEFCYAYVYDEFQPDPDFDRAIRVTAYDKGLHRYGVLDVLVIALRDELLEEPA